MGTRLGQPGCKARLNSDAMPSSCLKDWISFRFKAGSLDFKAQLDHLGYSSLLFKSLTAETTGYK